MKPLSDLTAQCIRCGFCLESCPTYSETGNEAESPRGRIYLVRSAEEGALEWGADVEQHLDLCLGCRACETACPSGVKYGEILEIARERLREKKPRPVQRTLLNLMTRAPGLLPIAPGQRMPGFVSQMLAGAPPEADTPRPETDREWPEPDEREMPPIKGEVYLLEGCVMRVLYPAVHQATRNLLRRVGYRVRPAKAACCGALHAHSGFSAEAKSRALTLARTMPDDLPVIANAAGCGSAMKEYGDWSPELAEFPQRVFDISEFLMLHGLADRLADAPGLPLVAAYHDACHLAHGQRIRTQPRALLSAVPGLRLVEMAESDLCCGSAGIYNITQPQMARRLLDRKWRNVESAHPDLLINGNPGCQAWLSQAAHENASQTRVVHTAEVLEAAFWGRL